MGFSLYGYVSHHLEKWAGGERFVPTPVGPKPMSVCLTPRTTDEIYNGMVRLLPWNMVDTSTNAPYGPELSAVLYAMAEQLAQHERALCVLIEHEETRNGR